MIVTDFLKQSGWLLLILGIALALRLVMVPYGLPYLFYEIEDRYYAHALQMGYGDFNPGYFHKPPFFLYFYFFFFYLSYLLSPFSDWAAFEAAFYQDPTQLALLARSITLGFALLSIGLLYRLGKKTFSKAVGLGAALLLALDTTHIRYSGIFMADIPALFFIIATAWFAFDVYQKGRWRDYLLCGACVALTMSFKYNAFVMAFPVAAHFLRYWPEQIHWRRPAFLRQALGDPRIWGLGAMAGGLFVVLSPYVLLNFSTFLIDMQGEKRHMLGGSTMEVPENHWFQGFYKLFFKVWPRTVTWPFYVLGWVAMAYYLRKVPRKALLLLSFPIAFCLVVSQFQIVTSKYLIPLLPVWYLLSVAFLHEAALWLSQRWPKRLPPRPVAILSLIVLAGLLFTIAKRTGRQFIAFQNQDTRLHARLYLDQRIQPGQRVYADPEMLPLSSLHVINTSLIGERTETTYTLLSDQPILSAILNESPPEYIVLSPQGKKDAHGRFHLKWADDAYPAITRHYQIETVFSPRPLSGGSPQSGLKPVTRDASWDATGDKDLPDHLDVLAQRLWENRQRPVSQGPPLIILKRRDLSAPHIEGEGSEE